jgi:hypothetical protein
MKKHLLISLLSICTLSSCFSQQLIKKQSDLRLLIDQRERFINKPLKDLLKEIKPPIKYAFGTDAKDHGIPAYFRFKFVTSQQTDSLRKRGLEPIEINVYVKEKDIDWYSRTKRTKETGLTWTADDLRNYGDFTVINIWVQDGVTIDN